MDEQPEPAAKVPKPSGTWLGVLLAFLGCFSLLTLMSVLPMRTVGPLLLMGTIVFGVVGLQYVVWGWYFERIYRGPGANLGDDDDPPAPSPAKRN